MPRIAGIELINERKITFALLSVYGVGPNLAKKVLEDAKVSGDKRVKELSEEEVSKIQKEVEKLQVEGDLRRSVTQNIRRLEEIGAYRGIRHRRGLPSRGQRTRSNARTKRGRRQTVGAIRKDMKAQAATKAPAA